MDLPFQIKIYKFVTTKQNVFNCDNANVMLIFCAITFQNKYVLHLMRFIWLHDFFKTGESDESLIVFKKPSMKKSYH